MVARKTAVAKRSAGVVRLHDRLMSGRKTTGTVISWGLNFLPNKRLIPRGQSFTVAARSLLAEQQFAA